MNQSELNKKDIENLLPHREPMLLIDKLTKIVPLKSATAIMYVKTGFMFKAIFQASHYARRFNCRGIRSSCSSINTHGIDQEYANKLVY